MSRVRQIKFDLDGIMKQTSKYVVGKSIYNFVSVYVASIVEDGKEYGLYTIADLTNDYRNLVIADDQETIIKEM